MGLAREAPVVVGQGVLRVEFDRLVVVLDGGGQVALSVAREAPVVVGDRVLRVELDRFGVVLDGAGQVVLIVAREAPVVVGDRVLRVELDRFGVVLDGTGQVVLIVAREAPVVVGDRVLRVELDRPGVSFDRLLIILGLLIKPTKSKISVRQAFGRRAVRRQSRDTFLDRRDTLRIRTSKVVRLADGIQGQKRHLTWAGHA